MKEKEFIASIAAMFEEMTPVNAEGIGDDCAVIPASGDDVFVVTTDMLCEGTHFLSNKISPRQLGHKSLAVNLSDIAAMGAEPYASFLSLGVPADIPDSWVAEFMKGYRALSDKFRTPLLGGDTVRNSSGIVINVTAMGRASRRNIKRRNGASPGDIVAVSGSLGGSFAGLKLLTECSGVPANKYEEKLICEHLTPMPECETGALLGKSPGITSMMDLSDGLYTDIQRLAECSKVAVEIFVDSVPVSEALNNVCKERNWNIIDMAVTGGEDYRLLFTLNPMMFEAMISRKELCFFPIGVVKEAPVGTVEYLYKGRVVDFKPCQLFDHFDVR